ncbi:MAG TPA: prepilin-type N-terminal cleavage/methylation domain-containing protein [Gemmatimonadaceae bacterium]|nr:prepilin-type N-terminal cleavage/methylation domain-containing protein [Gemmatimonadaceae bacterium]
MLTPRSRPGFTLAELLIALAAAAVLLAVIASIALRQQRLFAELADDAATTGRLREAIAMLPIDLRAVSPASGDIREARDTSLEIRATIASAIVCDTGGHTLTLGPALSGTDTFAAFLATVAAGDTAWVLDTRDAAEGWIPRRVTSVSSTTAARCANGGPVLSGPFTAIVVALDTLLPGRAGTVVRVTRPVRYSLYRSSDGSWQLGARDWNTTSLRLNTIQPVAGPFLPPSAGGLVFSYFDSNGAAVTNPVDPRAGLALVRVSARAQANRAARVLGAASTERRADSLDVAVFLHNRR